MSRIALAQIPPLAQDVGERATATAIKMRTIMKTKDDVEDGKGGATPTELIDSRIKELRGREACQIAGRPRSPPRLNSGYSLFSETTRRVMRPSSGTASI
jgi:hypothetical protein